MEYIIIVFKVSCFAIVDIREGTEQFTNASMHAYVKEFVQERDKFYSDFCDLMRSEVMDCNIINLCY